MCFDFERLGGIYLYWRVKIRFQTLERISVVTWISFLLIDGLSSCDQSL